MKKRKTEIRILSAFLSFTVAGTSLPVSGATVSESEEIWQVQMQDTEEAEYDSSAEQVDSSTETQKMTGEELFQEETSEEEDPGEKISSGEEIAEQFTSGNPPVVTESFGDGEKTDTDKDTNENTDEDAEGIRYIKGRPLTEEEREAALAKILPEQQGDFEKLYEALEGNPVTIRFLDPPLHEFVPTEEEDIKKLADAQGKTVEQIKTIIDSLHEFNPMMGHRGCRLAVTYPEIAKMQTSAVIRAAINVKKAHPDWNVKPEIMIPLVGDIKELKYVKKFVVETADAEIAAAGSDLEYEVGTMIEIPRAALTADQIASEADFFCFGTNDLTQMTYGFSRDDAGKFLDAYYDAKIFENDPFAKLDQTGVGKLMETAIKLGKPVNNKLHVGICGEHGGDPSSVEFCHKIGLDYVSCSPFRVPIARLAAAQAAIANK